MSDLEGFQPIIYGLFVFWDPPLTIHEFSLDMKSKVGYYLR